LTGQAGSVLVMVPAAFLVLLILGAIAVDGAASYLGQRQLADTLAAAANDAATAGLDNSAFYSSGRLVLSPPLVAAVVCRAIADQGDGDLHDLQVRIAVAGAAVELEGRARVDMIFERALPAAATRTVSAVAVARAEQAPSGEVTPPGHLVPLACAPSP